MMIPALSNWVEILFFVTYLVTLIFFYFSNGRSKKVLGFIILWSIVHSLLAYFGFYIDTEAFPPRFGLVLLPTIGFIIYGLLPRQMDWVYRNRDTKISTFLHSVRFPVEIVLFQLFIFGMVPELMTFEGRNFDIIMGITAPLVGYLLVKNKINTKGLIIWNIVGLFLITLILLNGILSAELPFQQFGFDQPNRAVSYFPFILLPAVIVPVVIWTHLSDLFKIWNGIKKDQKS